MKVAWKEVFKTKEMGRFLLLLLAILFARLMVGGK